MHLLIVHFVCVADCGSISRLGYALLYAVCMGVSEHTLFVVFNLNLCFSFVLCVSHHFNGECSSGGGGGLKWWLRALVHTLQNSSRKQQQQTKALPPRYRYEQTKKQRKTTTSFWMLLPLPVYSRAMPTGRVILFPHFDKIRF